MSSSSIGDKSIDSARSC